ncbi:helicase-related protein [Roseateles saccharophilus]|uniref:ATP-dependent RNA helicase SUPV3L1/SUV3 n=1 Tax=Roseateles saccharophilus TaxID=304 RepID=A0A4R3V764_ROSSA|nr:helicase-related protein [Roseateles saccharophilus]TCV00896.1 ATP-dependent RNA helicase SUPV3L1/SUV3 [Roseateles saccharophilus]
MKSSSSESRPAPPAFPLPQPRHAARLPAGLAPEDWARIRQAAHALPQVLTPADLDDGSEDALERLGAIQISKAAGGARPSRWILPAHIAVALAQLQATPQTNTLRPQLQQRLHQLESLGLRREGLVFTRLCIHPVVLAHEGWRIDLSHRVPVPEEPVWAFFRDGDAAALRHTLGQAPEYSFKAELALHLNHLIARSEAMGHASQLASLLPRLQAECGVPMPFDDLKAALTRAQDRWEQQVEEQDALTSLGRELAFQGYPDSFDAARKLGRKVTLYLGPPNSGKTYSAFERLAQALDGAYLAPLRLLALEGRDRLVGRGVPCSLLTGEENVPAANARVVSSTIEMVNTRDVIDVAVIDEAQMIFDDSRGWAWTQAIVGVPARELIIIASAYAAPAIERLLQLCGEKPERRLFERKQQVQLMPAPVPMTHLQAGDAVVAFSRRDVLMLRDQIAQDGHSVSVIYGALPPEVRRREAERFAVGASDVLVATDAIGMGLNLPIRRVLFSTLEKFDGVGDRELSVSEVHQIAGRAGRYGMHDEGFVSVLKEAEADAMKSLRQLLPKEPRAPRDFKCPVAPNWRHVQTISQRMGVNKLHAVLSIFMQQLRLDDAHFAVAELEQMLELAEMLDRNAAALPLQERFRYAQAPVDSRLPMLVEQYASWATNHARTGKAGEPHFLDEYDQHGRLDRMEQALRICTLWLWLDLRFPGVFGYVDAVVDLRGRLNDGIERQLKGKRPLWQRRGR